MGKNPQERNESFAFEQKLVEIDSFNDQEQKEVKEKVE